MTGKTVFVFLLLGVSCSLGIYSENENVQNTVQFSQEGEAWCEMCVLVMQQVGELVKQKDSQKIIDARLHEMCTMVSDKLLRQECFMLIPSIEHHLADGVNPEQICETLRVCGDGYAVTLIKSFFSRVDEHSNLWEDLQEALNSLAPHVETFMKLNEVDERVKSGETIACMMCKAAVGLLDRSFQQYKAPLVKYAVGICNDLPNPTNKACSDAMSYYIPVWWDAFFNDVASAGKVCQQLRVC